MNNRAVLILLFCTVLAIAVGTDLTATKNLYVKGRGIVGTDTLLHNVGFDLNTSGMTGSTQIGTYINPIFNSAATSGGYGLKIKPKIAYGSGVIRNVNILDIDNPFIGGLSSVNWIRGIHINMLYGADSGVYGIDIDRGKFRTADSSQLNGLVTFGAGMELHGRVVTSDVKFGDTDCVILFNTSAGAVRDTLPNIYSSLGRVMHFIQYSTSTAGNFVLYPTTGQTIDGYDSIVLRSALGLSRMTVFNQGDKWIITNFYEKGAFGIYLTGVNTPKASDTGYYIIHNDQYHLRIKPLLDTSNSVYLGVSGLNTYFTIAGLDSTHSATAAAFVMDSGVTVPGICLMPMNSTDISCFRSDGAPFKNTGTKGLPYGVQFNYTLPRRTVH